MRMADLVGLRVEVEVVPHFLCGRRNRRTLGDAGYLLYVGTRNVQNLH